VNVGASIEQQRHNRARASDHGAMQKRAARAIAPFEQRRIRTKHTADTTCAPRLCRQMDRLIDVSIVNGHASLPGLSF
jgi:hypothetical protein